jgi:hypothetical protein
VGVPAGRSRQGSLFFGGGGGYNFPPPPPPNFTTHTQPDLFFINKIRYLANNSFPRPVIFVIYFFALFSPVAILNFLSLLSTMLHCFLLPNPSFPLRLFLSSQMPHGQAVSYLLLPFPYPLSFSELVFLNVYGAPVQ